MPDETLIAVLPGDGIGPEVMAVACAVLTAAARAHGLLLRLEHAPLGGAAIVSSGKPLPDETLDLVRRSAGALAGAVGGPAWDHLPARANPGLGGMLRLRRELDLYANLRPAVSLPGRSPAIDVLLVREATGGAYFSEPRGRSADGMRAFDTIAYDVGQIRRIVAAAAELARSRGGRLASVDKANVLESSRLWREVAESELASSGLDVEHLYVDAAAYEIARDPTRFDVIVTENMFGDILSDQLAGQVGSLGLLPSAGLGDTGPGLYEPVHGSAPGLAGRDVANPVASIRSAALLLRHSLDRADVAAHVERACDAVLRSGRGTADIRPATVVGTRRFGELVLGALHAEA